MTNSDDSDVDVCSLDEDTLINLSTGLTVVAAETYVQTETKLDNTELIIPLDEKDLLKNKPRTKITKTSTPAAIQVPVKITTAQPPKSTKPKTKKPEKEIEKPVLRVEPLKREPKTLEEEEASLLDAGVNNKLHQFSFESDHLAIKNNTDYQALLKSLGILEAQRNQAIKDLEKLHSLKEKALSDPLKFVKDLQNKKCPAFPMRQVVAEIPEINWMHYITAYGGGSIGGAQIATRNVMKTQMNEFNEVDDDEKSDSENIIENNNNNNDVNKPASFNKKWTAEEQEKLEKLLVLYPPEEVEQRRWEKIAKALGNRTRKQVTSRIQKYFLKLAKAKLPIPGRAPSTVLLQQSRKAKVNPISYKNSSFFPSWKPKVRMSEDDDSANNMFSHENINGVQMSDDEDVPCELRASEEYAELMELKKMRKIKTCTDDTMSTTRVVHHGFMCDGCQMDPIVGVRWHCKDCPVDSSVDFCNNCVQTPISVGKHRESHELVSVHQLNSGGENDEDSGGGGSYNAFEQVNNFKYNYLDPNFVPDEK